jgi:hypothetical protein
MDYEALLNNVSSKELHKTKIISECYDKVIEVFQSGSGLRFCSSGPQFEPLRMMARDKTFSLPGRPFANPQHFLKPFPMARINDTIEGNRPI